MITSEYKILGIKPLERPKHGWRIILKLILKSGGRMLTEFSWLRKENSDGL
jgi:hypothetical protein